MKRLGLWTLLLVSLVACDSTRRASAIESELARTQRVDLARVMPGVWDRVCILGPYSTDQDAAVLVGAPWSLRDNSSAWASDGVSALVFVRGNTVVSSLDISRAKGDFSALSDKCFAHSGARFVRPAASRELVPESEPNNSFKPKPLRGSA